MKIDYDVIVAGSGPAGLTASLYLAREGYRVLNVTGEEPGGNLANISLIENYPGVEACSGMDLWKVMMKQCKEAGVEFLEFVNVSHYEVCGSNDIFAPVEVYFESDDKIIANAFISCIGGKHRTLGLSNEDEFFGKGISFCATCDGPLYKDRNVIIIGGGNSAIDFALTLSKYCNEVEIIHRRNQFRASSDMIEKLAFRKNIKINFNSEVEEICKNDIRDTFDVTIKNNVTKNEDILSGVHGIFYALGFERNFIPCRVGGMNNGTFSAGDCHTDTERQVITAAGDGCHAAMKCIEFLKRNGI